ncbi:hypothetical protein GB937_009370 [Aspergillus fischeri]|nr:hypothetical protein GB937_009370 [Aspergillus fischeri]
MTPKWTYRNRAGIEQAVDNNPAARPQNALEVVKSLTEGDTGGIAVLLSSTPHQFPGLKTIGKIVYILNLVLFLCISACLIIRFLAKSSALKESFQEPNESHFIGTCLLALATLILGAENYGTDACGPWLQVALRIVFWIYVALSTIQAIWHNWYLYHIRMASRQPFALVRLLPSFPAMLTGTIASVLASHQPRHHALPILIGGTTFQGFGFIMSLGTIWAVATRRMLWPETEDKES